MILKAILQGKGKGGGSGSFALGRLNPGEIVDAGFDAEAGNYHIIKHDDYPE